MSIKAIADAWKADLKTFPADERVYLDSRKEIYPPFGSDLTYTIVSSTPTQPGSHNLTGGNAYYMLELASTLSIRARVYPTFDYDTGDDQPIWSWYIDANNYLTLYYDQTTDHFRLKWKDGGTERYMQGPQISDNSHQAWTDFDCTIDLTTGTNLGSVMYINRSNVDTGDSLFNEWSGTIDAK